MEWGESGGWRAWAVCAGGLLVVLVWGTAAALPLLTAPETVEGLVVYPDDTDGKTFYYVPGAIRLAETDGTPQFTFRRMRYVGTKLMGDQGTFRGRGDISFTVEFDSMRDAVRRAHSTLKRTRNRRAVLLPIPVEEIQAELVYSVIEDGEAQQGERLATGLWAEPPEAPPDEGASAGQWASKSFEIALNTRTTQLMWQAYEENAVLLSLNYAVVAKGVSDINVLPREAQRRLDQLRRQIEGDEGKNGEPFEPTDIELEKIARTVRADALQIAVSPAKHPECFHSVDLDAEMPAGYVFLDVYCFDFVNDPDTAIVKKRVEIRGYGIAGGRPKVKVEFRRSTPDITSQAVRFELAVDLDKGYEYRVVDFDDDGNMTPTDWVAVKDWNGILDVTCTLEEPEGAAEESTGDVDENEE
jgi:hypothetical protein